MKNILILCACAAILAACAHAKPPGPWTDNFNDPRSAAVVEEARPFIIKRQGCDHFRGEPPFDERRKEFLLAQMKELCTGTDAELKRLRAKYSNQPETIKALADFDDCIEYETQCSKQKPE